MIPYRKFSDGLKNEVAAPPKPAKASEVSSANKNAAQSLGGLGALAGVAPSREFSNAPATAWGDAHEERAAVIEYDGGVPRAWAEALARLDPRSPPADVPPKRWLRFIDDCARFLDDGWAARAAALDWGPLDLFGCDRDRPFARIDRLGLLWLLNGDTVIELHRYWTVLETKSGARQSYRRRLVEVDRAVPAWELAPISAMTVDLKPTPAASISPQVLI